MKKRGNIVCDMCQTKKTSKEMKYVNMAWDFGEGWGGFLFVLLR